MRRIAFLMIAAMLVAPAFAEGEESAERDAEAVEVLNKVDAAIKAVSSVQYRSSVKATGDFAEQMNPAKGKATFKGWSNGTPEMFLVEVETIMPGSDTPVHLSGGGNGEEFFLIDHTSKKAYVDMDPNVMGTGGQALQAMLTIEFVHEAPFDDEIGADKVQMTGSEKVGDEDCYKIDVFYTGGRGHTTWLFSKKDFLPRGRIMHFTGERNGTIVRELFDVQADPDVDASAFAFKLPEGYERIDDFAP